ncbi:hypothetical protein [Actinophytocola oryzae]|nr:hypothetical protein [Actinophytocola oryzae]
MNRPRIIFLIDVLLVLVLAVPVTAAAVADQSVVVIAGDNPCCRRT